MTALYRNSMRSWYYCLPCQFVFSLPLSFQLLWLMFQTIEIHPLASVRLIFGGSIVAHNTTWEDWCFSHVFHGSAGETSNSWRSWVDPLNWRLWPFLPWRSGRPSFSMQCNGEMPFGWKRGMGSMVRTVCFFSKSNRENEGNEGEELHKKL